MEVATKQNPEIVIGNPLCIWKGLDHSRGNLQHISELALQSLSEKRSTGVSQWEDRDKPANHRVFVVEVLRDSI